VTEGSILSTNKQMISLATNYKTSIKNMNYMVVTCHYIDVTMNKKNIEFKYDLGSNW
jgi:hypothetical protein